MIIAWQAEVVHPTRCLKTLETITQGNKLLKTIRSETSKMAVEAKKEVAESRPIWKRRLSSQLAEISRSKKLEVTIMLMLQSLVSIHKIALSPTVQRLSFKLQRSVDNHSNRYCQQTMAQAPIIRPQLVELSKLEGESLPQRISLS